jgi:hypothetical protein
VSTKSLRAVFVELLAEKLKWLSEMSSRNNDDEVCDEVQYISRQYHLPNVVVSIIYNDYDREISIQIVRNKHIACHGRTLFTPHIFSTVQDVVGGKWRLAVNDLHDMLNGINVVDAVLRRMKSGVLLGDDAAFDDVMRRYEMAKNDVHFDE